MEAFSLLKYWRAAGGGNTTTSSSAAATILTAASPSSSSSSSSDSGNDDGPFFDLEFTVPDDEDDDDESSDSDDQTESPENVAGDDAENDEAEVKLTISSSSAAAAAGIHEETAPKFPVASILKSASKFRVQMRKFNKPKPDSRQKEKVEDSGRHRRRENGKSGSKLLTVKLKVEEAVPLVSVLFSRDHNNSTNRTSETPKENAKTTGAGDIAGAENNITEDGEEERKFAKELMNKYLKKVKPLYVRASKRYGDKLRLSTPAAAEDAEKHTSTPPEKATASGKGLKQGNIQAGLKVVCKHLGKSRSASASAPPPPSSAAPGPETSSSRRRDDSLLQQQDGIQSAIMHCKRSFNASRDSGSSVLSRSVR